MQQESRTKNFLDKLSKALRSSKDLDSGTETIKIFMYNAMEILGPNPQLGSAAVKSIIKTFISRLPPYSETATEN
eukprot:snap_masked-scaffold_22-processed-gene-2.31-mRNA-1 protein AED:1.00 eAED:1.00 QI:0/-1/0/0/-1/1/1/0/74